jgi:hypothetical protein
LVGNNHKLLSFYKTYQDLYLSFCISHLLSIFPFLIIKVSNFGWQQLQALKETGCETPDLNQIELHIFNQQNETVEYCRKEGIVVEGHCPLARNKRFDGQTKLVDIAKKLNRTGTLSLKLMISIFLIL